MTTLWDVLIVAGLVLVFLLFVVVGVLTAKAGCTEDGCPGIHRLGEVPYPQCEEGWTLLRYPDNLSLVCARELKPPQLRNSK